MKFLNKIKSFLTYILVFIAIFLLLLLIWLFRTWPNLKMDELAYTMNTLQGAGNDQVSGFIKICLLPCLFIFLTFLYFNIRFKNINKKKSVQFSLISSIISLSLIICSILFFVVKMDVITYIKSFNDTSSFVEKEYVDPNNVDIVFPEKKRNLIYIYLESMETSYASKDIGGG